MNETKAMVRAVQHRQRVKAKTQDRGMHAAPNQGYKFCSMESSKNDMDREWKKDFKADNLLRVMREAQLSSPVGDRGWSANPPESGRGDHAPPV